MMEREKKAPGTEEGKRGEALLIFGCIFLYFIMAATKNVYTAELVVIGDAFGIGKAEAGLALTYYFVSYAAVQVVLTFFVDKIPLPAYMTATTALSALLFVFVSYAATIETYFWVFAVNGLLQAGVYSGCVSLFSRSLSPKMLVIANKALSMSTVGSTVLSYAVSALCVSAGHWEWGFRSLGILYLCAVAVFFVVMHRGAAPDKMPKKEAVVAAEPLGKRETVLYYVLLLTISFVINAVYFSLTSWFPNLLYEVFGVPKTYSILFTVCVPTVAMFGPILVIDLCEKRDNLYRLGLLIGALPLVFFTVLSFLYAENLWLSMILLLITVLFVNGFRTVFGTVIAFRAKKQISSGGFMAISNAIASFAASAAPTVGGAVIDGAGWQAFFICIAAAVLLLLLILLLPLCFLKNKIPGFTK